METYKCINCKSICEIHIIKDTEKSTEPTIEFCPFCGISNQNQKKHKKVKRKQIYD